MAMERNGYGYLDDEHFFYAQKYLKRLRSGKSGPTLIEIIEEALKKIKKAWNI